MGAFIMDHFVPRERCKALIIMTRSYVQLDLEFVKKNLRFDSMEELNKFLKDRNSFVEVRGKRNFLDCKEARKTLEEVYKTEFMKKVDIKGQI